MTEEKHTSPISEKDIPPWLQPVPDEEEGSGNPLEGKKMMLITAGVAVTVVALFVLVLFYLYDDAGDGTPRHVVADNTPVRERPAEPGGMDVPHQDKAVLDQGSAGAASTVQLAPQTEEPLTKLPEEPADQASAIDDLVDQVTREAEADAPAASAPSSDAAAQSVAQSQSPVTEPARREPQQAVETAPAAQVPASSQAAPAQPTAPAYRVQLGAYGSEESAARAWRTIRGKFQSILGTLEPIYEAVQSGDRTLYRLRVGPLDTRAAADEVCLGLRAQQQACIVVNP